ncbi:MAG: endonuclease/exonuclease/phosphatase family protein [Planctomycetia bacterium]
MRLLSWNIHKGIGGRDRRYALDRIVACIEAENPDLVCLQEVDRLVQRSRCDDQPRLLAHALRFHSVFQQNVPVGAGSYGNLVLSRWPVASRHRIGLRRGTRKPRGAQLLVIESPEGPLHLVHTHLGLAERERRWQVERLLGHMLFRSADRHPTLVVGDFNDWRDSLAPVLAAGGFHHVTSPVGRFRTFPAWLAIGALDKVFARGPIDVRQARVVRTSLAKVASDHLPVVIDFHLR